MPVQNIFSCFPYFRSELYDNLIASQNNSLLLNVNKFPRLVMLILTHWLPQNVKVCDTLKNYNDSDRMLE